MASQAQDPGSARRRGLFGSVKVLAGTLLAIVHTRLELLSTDLEEEMVWLGAVLVWALVGLFCGSVGLVLATLFFVFALWDSHRLLALGIPAILFLVGTCVAWLVVRGKVKARPTLFAATLAELSKDREQFTSQP